MCVSCAVSFFIDLLLLCFLNREKEDVLLNEQRGEEGTIWEEIENRDNDKNILHEF